jgi:Ion channel
MLPGLPYFPVRPDPPLLEVFAVGAAVLVAITLAHGAILGFIVRDYHRGAKRMLQNANHPFWASVQFGRAVLLMLVLHILDMAIWAAMLNHLQLVPNARDSFYFTANSYTTLGYGNVPLGLGWRELSPMIAISGLFTFAWTTGVMFNVVGYQRELSDQLANEFARKRQLHRNLLAELNALRVQEAGQERSAIGSERAREAGLSLVERCKLRWEQRRELFEIRRTAMAQATAALEREREAKEKIYQPPPTQTPRA